jgi:hypothetical protein
MARPTTLTVIGILAIIFGSLGVVCTPLLLVVLLNPELSGEFMPDLGGLHQTFQIVSLSVGIFASLALVADGIGLLQMKEWARKLGIGLGVYYILASFVGAAVQIVAAGPMMKEMADATGSDAAMIGGVVGGIFGILINSVIYGLILYFLTRPDVKYACQTDPVEQAYAGSL